MESVRKRFFISAPRGVTFRSATYDQGFADIGFHCGR